MKYTIMMGCGHEDTVVLFGNGKDREKKIEYFKTYGLCKNCYKKKKEEEAKKEGFIFNAAVLPYIDNFDGSILLLVWFSGNTIPHKDDIKSLGGYAWRERESSVDFYSSIAPSMCWNKIVKLSELQKEITKAVSIRAQHTILETNLFATAQYKIALKKQVQWFENKATIDKIAKPSVPDILKDHKWNQKIYGKSGNYTIYLDGEKVFITNDQVKEIKKYLKSKEEYNNKVKEIKNA